MDEKELQKLAIEFLNITIKIKQCNSHRKIDESSKGETFCLLYLKEVKQEVSPNELSNEMHISTARVAAILNTLQKKELITREINSTDRRKIVIKLTDKGLKKAKQHKKDVTNEIETILKSIGTKDSQELLRIITKINKILEKEGKLC